MTSQRHEMSLRTKPSHVFLEAMHKGSAKASRPTYPRVTNVDGRSPGLRVFVFALHQLPSALSARDSPLTVAGQPRLRSLTGPCSLLFPKGNHLY